MIFKRLKKPDPQKEQTLRDAIENEGGLDKKDMPAMILSALLVIMPVAIVVLLVMVLAIWLFL
jgi:hypothetical protein